MPKNITQYELLISCPGDVKAEIQIIHDVVSKFNSEFSNTLELMIQERHWSKDAYPASGDKPQAILNKQFVNNCDAAVAIFWSRFGTPTDEYGSGSEEEIAKMLAEGKQVFMYFSKASVPYDEIDNEQLEKVKKFKNIFKEKGLYWEYTTTEEFKALFYAHLTQYFLSLAKVKEITQDKMPELEVKLLDAETEEISDKTYIFTRPDGLITYRELSEEDIFDDIKELVSVEDIQKYNDGLPPKEEVEEYNKQKRFYENAQNNCHNFRVSFSNSGNAKANEIYVDLEFPNGVIAYYEDDIEDIKEPNNIPSIPTNPIYKAMDDLKKKKFKSLYSGFDNMFAADKIFDQINSVGFGVVYPVQHFSSLISAKNFTPRKYNYSISNYKTLSMHVDNLLHTREYRSNVFSLIFTELGEFEINYSIMCEEWEEPVKGQFLIKVVNTP